MLIETQNDVAFSTSIPETRFSPLHVVTTIVIIVSQSRNKLSRLFPILMHHSWNSNAMSRQRFAAKQRARRLQRQWRSRKRRLRLQRANLEIRKRLGEAKPVKPVRAVNIDESANCEGEETMRKLPTRTVTPKASRVTFFPTEGIPVPTPAEEIPETIFNPTSIFMTAMVPTEIPETITNPSSTRSRLPRGTKTAKKTLAETEETMSASAGSVLPSETMSSEQEQTRTEDDVPAAQQTPLPLPPLEPASTSDTFTITLTTTITATISETEESSSSTANTITDTQSQPTETLLPPLVDRIQSAIGNPIDQLAGALNNKNKEDVNPSKVPLIAGLAVAAVVSVFLLLVATHLFKKTPAKQGNIAQDSIPKDPESKKGGKMLMMASTIFAPITNFISKLGKGKEPSPKEALSNAVKDLPTASKYDIKSVFYEHIGIGYDAREDFRNNHELTEPEDAILKDEKGNSLYSQVTRPSVYSETHSDYAETLDTFDMLARENQEINDRRATGYGSEINFIETKRGVSVDSEDIFLNSADIAHSQIRYTKDSATSVPLHLNTPLETDNDSFIQNKIYSKFDNEYDDTEELDINILDEIEKRDSVMSQMSIENYNADSTNLTRTTGFSYDLDFIEEQIALKNNLSYTSSVAPSSDNEPFTIEADMEPKASREAETSKESARHTQMTLDAVFEESGAESENDETRDSLLFFEKRA